MPLVHHDSVEKQKAFYMQLSLYTVCFQKSGHIHTDPGCSRSKCLQCPIACNASQDSNSCNTLGTMSALSVWNCLCEA